jgi:hypothetical protein
MVADNARQMGKGKEGKLAEQRKAFAKKDLPASLLTAIENQVK